MTQETQSELQHTSEDNQTRISWPVIHDKQRLKTAPVTAHFRQRGGDGGGHERGGSGESGCHD